MPGILVVGPGAIGGALACRWVEAGREVLLLGRDAASEKELLARGISFTGTSGTTRLIKGGLLSARQRGPRPPVEAAFFCVKSYQLARAAKAARPFVGPDTAVVSLENGVGHERALRRAFGPRRTVIGICYIAADRPAPFSVAHNGGKDVHLAVGPRNAACAAAAAALLAHGGWAVSQDRDEDTMLWTKLCFNVAGNALGALCNATNGEVARDPALRELLVGALREAVTAARKDGHKLLYPDMESLIVKTYPNDSRQRNSMLQDLQAGRPTEADAILGPVISAARRRKVPLTLLPRLHRLVKSLEAAL
jgi:2-dehydropantoate 2-reductase